MSTTDIIADNFNWFARTCRQRPEVAQVLRDEWLVSGRYETLVVSFDKLSCGIIPHERILK